MALGEHHHLTASAGDFKLYTMVPVMMTVVGFLWLWEDLR